MRLNVLIDTDDGISLISFSTSHTGTSAPFSAGSAAILASTSMTDLVIAKSGSAPIHFATNSTIRATISAVGNLDVGGIANPLPTNTPIFAQRDHNAQTNIWVENVNTGSGAYASYVANSDVNTCRMGSTSSTATIGAIPASAGFINVSPGEFWIQTGGTNKIAIAVNQTERFHVDSSGNTKVFLALEVDGAFNHDGSTFGALGATPAAQQAVTALTDSTGGTANDTLVAISGSGDDANINDNFADLAAKINELRGIFNTFGFNA